MSSILLVCSLQNAWIFPQADRVFGHNVGFIPRECLIFSFLFRASHLSFFLAPVDNKTPASNQFQAELARSNQSEHYFHSP